LNSKDIFSAISSNSGVTPQMALLQTMATMHQKVRWMSVDQIICLN
jgi:ferredoxin-NADP reductase